MYQQMHQEMGQEIREGVVLNHKIFEDLLKKMKDGEATELAFPVEGGSVVRRWVPRERLILLGGGHIALSLCRIGAMLDFSVAVVDDRPAFANHLRFPEAETVICGGFGETIDRLKVGAEDFICVITRGHRHDADCLRRILAGTMPKYLGMIGSKRRVAGLMELLAEEGYDGERLKQVHAPIGLSIHAQTTTEIAISIAAQLVECRRSRKTSGQESECLMLTNVDMALLETLAVPKEPLVVALVVDTKGSTPVKSGAMMAVGRLGRVEGTIGGGCGEAEITQIARHMAGTGETKVVSVNMSNEVAEEEGMVCGGIMKVLLMSMEE